MKFQYLILVTVLSISNIYTQDEDNNEYYDNEYPDDYENPGDYEDYYDGDTVFEMCKGYDVNNFYSSSRGKSYYIYCAEDAENCFEQKCPEDSPVFKNGECGPETETDPEPEAETEPEPELEPETTTKEEEEEEEEEEEIEEPETTTKKIVVETTEKPITTKKKTEPTTKLSKGTTTTSKADKKTTTEIENVENCPQSDNPRKIVFISSKASCSQYFVCYHGNPISMFCADKLHFNPRINKCDLPENSGCMIEEPIRSKPKCKSIFIEFYEHPDKCDLFYYCNRAVLSVQRCPYMHHFNLKSKSCIRKHLSSCKDKI